MKLTLSHNGTVPVFTLEGEGDGRLFNLDYESPEEEAAAKAYIQALRESNTAAAALQESRDV